MCTKIIMPDFVEWAKQMVDKEDVAIALEQAFNQGYSLGHMHGFEEGSNTGWQKIWDADKGFIDGQS